ncbi:response regulator transcription factor [Thauera chlorobenzoica]|uniref:response regulator n=1 Tax=Thauera chlorobenzoica TaxID=96773 RepID=UPI0008A04137|nr:response regulator transcription factor [Thauera chlorobenzoica]SEF85073.1 two-component system, OmpR family, response regulator/two-component system, OmpR family, response regulator QseB [Thauera chlorobenzoica]
MKILLVEDDELLGDGIQAGLEQAGFTVDWARDGSAAAHALDTGAYQAAVLDLGLPRLSGMDVLRRARAAGLQLPILILTARDALADRVAGLDAGADDYVVKPFELAELQARLRALVRRASGSAAPLLTCGALQLDPGRRQVRFGGRAVALTTREFAILHALLLGKGRVLSKAQLEEQLYGWGEEVGSNTVEVFIHHLRRKLAPGLIRTVRGVGYLIEDEPSQENAGPPQVFLSPSGGGNGKAVSRGRS